MGIFYSCVNNDTVHVTTVENEINKYTVREYSYAKKACDLQNIIGRPSTQDPIKYIENNMIPNCPMTRQDILRAEDIFGPNIRSIKGKMTHTKQKHVQVDLQDTQEVTSRKIHFGTTELVNDMKNNKLIASIDQVMQAYQTRGFKIKAILADG